MLVCWHMIPVDAIPSVSPPRGFSLTPGFPGYATSRDGRVASCRLVGRGSRLGASWHVLQPMQPRPKPPTKPAYLKVHVRLPDGRRRKVPVHQFVLLTFVGPCPAGMEACHGNGHHTDNRLDNLRWDTPRANNADKLAHGTHLRGERVGSSKLTAVAVREILLSSATTRVLARDHGVSTSAIRQIKARCTWKHVHPTTTKEIR